MKITNEFMQKIKTDRNLQLVIQNLVTLAATVAEVQKSVAAIEARMGMDKTDEIGN